MLNVTQIFSLIETLRQTTLAKIKLEGKNTEKEMESVTLHTGRGDAGSTQNNLNGSKQDTHTDWNTTWRLEDL